MFKKYLVIDAKTKDELEGFSTLESAEKFLYMMKKRGMDVILKTNDEDIIEDDSSYDIEGLEQVEPTSQFGDDLNTMFSDDNEASFGTTYESDDSDNEPIDFDDTDD